MADARVDILKYPDVIPASGGLAIFHVAYESYKTISLAESNFSYQDEVIGMGQNSITMSYDFRVPANPYTSSHLWPVTFSCVGEDDYAPFVYAYATINQLGSYVPSFSLSVSPQQVNIASNVVSVTASVVLEGISSGEEERRVVWQESFGGNITDMRLGAPTKSSDYEYTYPLYVDVYPNSTAQTVTSVGYVIASSGSTSSSVAFTVVQDPSGYRITAPSSYSFSPEGGSSEGPIQVVYEGDLAIDDPVYPSWIKSWRVSSSNSSTKDYYFGLEPNTGSTSRSGYISWSMGGGEVTASTQISQPISTGSLPEVEVYPEKLTVGSYSTRSVIQVTYRQAVGLSRSYSVDGPGSPTLTLSGSSTSGANIQDVYFLDYPSNPTANTLVRTCTFRINSGSEVLASGNSVVTQLPSSSYQSIYINPSSVNLSQSETSFTVQAFYSGISDISAITAPVANVEGWTAIMESYVASPTDVSVYWTINGTSNLESLGRTIVFTFNAVGIGEEGILTISQEGTGDIPLAGSGSIVAWKDTETFIPGTSSSYEVVSTDANGNLLFDERIYKAPDQAYFRINFNRLAESFLEPRDLSNSQSNIFSFNTILREDGGYERLYSYRVLDDWSYEDRDPRDRYVLSHPYQKEVAIGSYLVFSTMNDEDGTTREAGLNVKEDPIRLLESRSVEAGRYSDIMYLVDPLVITPCSTISAWEGGPQGFFYDYKVIDNIKYAIYYYNKFGGWDSFMIKGPVVPSVDATRNNYMNSRRNTRTYQVGVVDRYRVNTGILTDEESLAIAEIVSSPRVILHKIDRASTLIPVKASTNSVEKKTFRNQGHQFATYQFDLEADLNQIRR